MFPRAYFGGDYFPETYFPPVAASVEPPPIILAPPDSYGWSEYIPPNQTPEDEELVLTFLATRFPH